MEGVEVYKVRHSHADECGLTSPEEGQETLVPHKVQNHPQRSLALPPVLELDPGEGRCQGHRHTRRSAAPHAARTGVNKCTVVEHIITHHKLVETKSYKIYLSSNGNPSQEFLML